VRLYYWIHHTGEYERTTGVQRVVRNLAATLWEGGHEVVPVRWCSERESIVRAERRWIDGLGRDGGPHLIAGPDEGTPLHLASADDKRLDEAWLLMPEVPHVAGERAPNLPVALDYARFYGMRSATVFYDLIPLRQHGYEAMAEAHAQYVRALAGADVLLAISAHAAHDVQSWWAEHDYEPARLPPVAKVPLPAELRGLPRVRHSQNLPDHPVRFVTLGTVEPRKNQVETMHAFMRLCSRRRDLDLRLDVVGAIHHAVSDQVRDLAAREPRIRLHEYLAESEARDLVAASHASVFMSRYEGFGLPIAESLWQGKPCLCSDHGAMIEIAAGGGCLPVPAADGEAIEHGLERLAVDAVLRSRLAQEACTRALRTWHEYAAAVVETLDATTSPHRLVAVEGSRGISRTPEILARSGVSVRRLHWRPESRALLPGGRRAPQVPDRGAGHLDGMWAVLPVESTAGGDETARIIAAAHGLGLRVAMEAKAQTPSPLLAAADLVLFPTESERDAALAAALRDLPRTVGLREKFQVGVGNAALPALGRSRSRTSEAGQPKRPRRIFYWVGLTVTQPFNTGVQRVTRLLGAALQRLGVELVPVKWDERASRIVPVSAREAKYLAAWSGPAPSPSQPLPESVAGEWMLMPEIVVPTPHTNVVSAARNLGMRVAAIFYDVIPAKMPEHYPSGLESFAEYWRWFADVDVALPISWTVAADLHRWLADEDLPLPVTVPCPLAGEGGGAPRITSAASPQEADSGPLKVLAIGTWEPRKNYPRLMRALMLAQSRASRPIELTIVGRRAGFSDLDSEIERLGADAGVVLHGHVADDTLLELYKEAGASVFASWEEGFGLPVVESLWNGRPCLCHDGSAMAELVSGGGVLTADMLDEAAIADGLVRLADEPGLLARLGREAVTRQIRTWDEYAEDVLGALSHVGAAPGWPLLAIGRRRPLLSIAITTYNRARWLRHSLSRVLEATRPWRDVVEVVVCDNASTDETPDVIAAYKGEPNFSAHRNATNVGMLGNLGATARASDGAFVWMLGDDDLLMDGAIENVLEGLASHPEVEMAYMNYAYTRFDDPARLESVESVLTDAIPIAFGGPNRRVRQLREVAGLNENLFTAIYACAFRRDHALRAYQLDTRGEPFTSLLTCVPSAVYALAALQERPAWWVGEPAVVVNMNVSWLRWALLWHLERMPDLFEEAERQGVDPTRLDGYRLTHLVEAGKWVRMVYFDAEDAVRRNFSLARLLERCKHLSEFRERHLPGLRRVYSEAWTAGRVVVDPIPPDELFARYGL
jgi:glycosyltransferase involved in cell wall biosynthesis